MTTGKLKGRKPRRRAPGSVVANQPRSVVLGLKPRTGRASVVALAGPTDAPEILLKTHIDVAFTFEEGAVFHVAQELPIDEARMRLEDAQRRFIERAHTELVEIERRLGARIVGAGIVVGSAKPLPPLEAILKSHPLVHAAEGALYRRVFTSACTALSATAPLSVSRDALSESLSTALGVAPKVLLARLAAMGKASGKPWAEEQKQATLAAWIALASANQ